MIDTHCHLDFSDFDIDRQAVIARSRQAGVNHWVVPGVRLQDFSRIYALQEPGILPALGLHPMFMTDHGARDIEQLETWIIREKPVAIGEIGLDYMAPIETHAAQALLLDQQLALAKHHKLPVLLHVRKAHDQVLSRLRHFKLCCAGIVHAFNGSIQQANGYLALGFKLGFGGVVTRQRAKRIRQLAQTLPDDALVLETDAPDLPPENHLGQRNEPAYLTEVVETLAQLRQVDQSRIIEMTNNNAHVILQLEQSQ
ncbi:MAG: TatD family hydrolase [Magnetococcales bacterium]|nr:TatD family hydrolase [Magnetococcales bacterium]